MQVPLIKKSKEKGLFTIVVDYDKEAPGFNFADKKYFISTHDKDKVLQIAKENKVDGIVTSSDFPVKVVAYVCEELKLSGLKSDVAEICTDKYLLREKINNTELNSPKYRLLEKVEDLYDINLSPAIIKPVDSSASRGVEKVVNKEQLLKAYQNSLVFSNSKKVIIEEFIEGREFSVESYTNNNRTEVIAITEKKLVGKEKGCFVEFSHKIPANISEIEKELISTATKKLINIIGLNNSASHTEIILSNNKAYIVEIGARPGGDFIASDLVYLSTGVDMLNIVIDGALGLKVKYNYTKNCYSAIQFITPQNYFSAQKFIKEKNKHIYKYVILNYEEKEIKNSLDRLGYIIFKAKTETDLNKLVYKINNENK